jgi:hypothetical protein
MRSWAICGSGLALSAALCSVAGCAPPLQAAAPSAEAGAEILALQSVVTRVAHHIDARRWQELRSLFSDEVETDYRSLFGGEVQKQSADQLVLEGWRRMLTPLQTTQHFLGPIDVHVQGREARAECHVRAYHRAPNAPGGPEWMVAGHYVFSLVQANGGWKIRRLELQAAYQTGNTRLLQEAAVSTQSSSR